MTATIIFVALAACLPAAMTGAWLVALRTGQSGWIDAIWSFATGCFAAAAALVPLADNQISVRQVLVAALALVWSLRLGIHIAVRTARGGGDDPRYRQLREEWGDAFKVRLLWFLQIQALVGLALALSITLAAHNPAPGLRFSDWLAFAFLSMAVLGESIADCQLSAFRAHPVNKGKVCDVGLWGMSRHPNYFFEWLHWFAYPIIGLAAGQYVLWIYPLLMWLFLYYVTGIPFSEKQAIKSRGQNYLDYQQKTSTTTGN